MKKQLRLLLVIALLLIAGPMYADDLYPLEITFNDDGREIQKIYRTDDPERIPKEDFTRDYMTYTLMDIVYSEVPITEYKKHEEMVTEWSKTQDTAAVLDLLPASKDVVIDGYAGTLLLDTSSIKTEISDYGNSTKTVTTTRSYPNLAAADAQNVPKSITENGIEMTLADVQWNNVADLENVDRFTAYVTYTGTAKSSYIKGYNISAKYIGTLQKTATDSRYTAIFMGQEVAQDRNWPMLVMTAWAIAMSFTTLGLIGWQCWYKKRKEDKEDSQGVDENLCQTENVVEGS